MKFRFPDFRMRLNRRFWSRQKWRPWFAWFPVKITDSYDRKSYSNEWVWFQNVFRRYPTSVNVPELGIWFFKYPFEYSLIKNRALYED